jgi:hypothetical protein
MKFILSKQETLNQMEALCLAWYQNHLEQNKPADANNLIDIAARCLLIEDGNRLILIQEWDKQSEKFYGYYSLGISFFRQIAAKYGFSQMTLQMFYDAFAF